MKCVFCDKWCDKPAKCKACRRWFCLEHINGHKNICYDARANIKAECEAYHNTAEEETKERIVKINETLEKIKVGVENEYLKTRIEDLEAKLNVSVGDDDSPARQIVKEEIVSLTASQKKAIKCKIAYNNKRIEKIEKKVEQSASCDRLSKGKPKVAAKKPRAKAKTIAEKKPRGRPRKSRAKTKEPSKDGDAH